jgi:Tol biopolymer transport system component
MRRALGPSTSGELIDDVLASLEAQSQAYRWRLWLVPRRRLMWVLAAIALVITLLAGTTAGNRAIDLFSDPGVIAFSSATYSRGDYGGLSSDQQGLFTISVRGGGQNLLVPIQDKQWIETNGAPDHVVHGGLAVRWSPDGTRVAFRQDGYPQGLYVVNRDGSDPRRLADVPGPPAVTSEEIASFAWSPDGSRIAYISPIMPAWPPDGAQNGSLFVIDVGSGEVDRLNGAANGSVAWSPDGSTIAFARTQRFTDALVLIDADGTDERFFEYGYLKRNHLGPIAWSPDGTRIALVQERFGGAGEGDYLMVVRSDGSDPRELDHWQSGCCQHGAFGGLIEWSPDGTSVATPIFVPTPSAGQWRVLRTAADGSGAQVSILGHWFDWSPDGSRLVVSAPGTQIDDGRYQAGVSVSAIYIVDADGSNRRWLADGDYPAWSP